MNLRKLELIVRRRKVIAAEKQFKEAQDGGGGKAETGCCVLELKCGTTTFGS